MEENGSISKSNKNKAIINCRKALKDHCWWENRSGTQESFGDGGDLVGEFSWPPRFYTCTFCKREFRSAQALGGHMNVHRREKAKLRQITPPRYLPLLPPSSHYFSSNSKLLDLNPNPNPNISTCFASNTYPNRNPNPNITTCFASNTSSFPTMIPPFTYSCFLPFSAPCPFHHLCHSDSANFTTMRSEKSELTSGGLDGVSHENTNMILKKSETSLFVETKLDDMDLELRLGCS